MKLCEFPETHLLCTKLECVGAYLQVWPGGFQCRLILLWVKLWILTRWESPEDIYRDLENHPCGEGGGGGGKM